MMQCIGEQSFTFRSPGDNSRKSTTQGQGTTSFTGLSCSVITCTEYNLRKEVRVVYQ